MKMSGEGHQRSSLSERMQGMGEGVSVQGMGEGSQLATEAHELISKNSSKRISICPMCHGKGYYEEVVSPGITINMHKQSDHILEKKITTLPSINTQQQESQVHKLEEIFKAKDAKAFSRVSDPAMQKVKGSNPNIVKPPNSRLPPVHLASTLRRRANSTAGMVRSSPNNSNIANLPQLVNLLPPPARLEKNAEDVVRLAVIKLNRTDWETKKAALEECLQLAHYHPDVLDAHMSLVYRTMSALLNNFRPQVTLFTCQAAREFFAHMRSTCRPEFDELVFALLSRTADTNRYIRIYANDALDKMVTYIPTVHAVRPLVEKGPVHNNPLVRTATARLLTCIVALKTPNVILTHANLKDSCKRILETAAALLSDSNLDTRATAKKLFLRFMNEEEFESVYYADVSEKLRKRIDRTYIELKYKKHSQV